MWYTARLCSRAKREAVIIHSSQLPVVSNSSSARSVSRWRMVSSSSYRSE